MRKFFGLRKDYNSPVSPGMTRAGRGSPHDRETITLYTALLRLLPFQSRSVTILVHHPALRIVERE